jgi:hypothetical protein
MLNRAKPFRLCHTPWPVDVVPMGYIDTSIARFFNVVQTPRVSGTMVHSSIRDAWESERKDGKRVVTFEVVNYGATNANESRLQYEFEVPDGPPLASMAHFADSSDIQRSLRNGIKISDRIINPDPSRGLGRKHLATLTIDRLKKDEIALAAIVRITITDTQNRIVLDVMADLSSVTANRIYIPVSETHEILKADKPMSETLEGWRVRVVAEPGLAWACYPKVPVWSGTMDFAATELLSK